tara:strand:- start:3859 stop:4173 length:315 start_codon:yes stop_codon:yes gene_type:complete
LGWSKINGHTYYYRSKYVDGQVQTTYCGKGEAAKAAAASDRLKAKLREHEQQQDTDYFNLVSQKLESLHKDAYWIETLLRIDAISHGFIRYKAGSEWRMRSAHA